MSRIGKLPIAVPSPVKVELKDQFITVKGAKSELKMQIPADVVVKFDNGAVNVTPANDSAKSKAMWGTIRTRIANMVKGVTEGFSDRLEINGVGYRAAVDKGILTIVLGYSHEIKYAIPAGIEMKAEKPTLLQISGADKQLVGQVSAEIRELRKPEPYKGKGVKYEGETIRRKEGKKK